MNDAGRMRFGQPLDGVGENLVNLGFAQRPLGGKVLFQRRAIDVLHHQVFRVVQGTPAEAVVVDPHQVWVPRQLQESGDFLLEPGHESAIGGEFLMHDFDGGGFGRRGLP